MNVCQLIEELRKLPEESDVILSTGGSLEHATYLEHVFTYKVVDCASDQIVCLFGDSYIFNTMDLEEDED